MAVSLDRGITVYALEMSVTNVIKYIFLGNSFIDIKYFRKFGDFFSSRPLSQTIQ
jgi:hypothetical protein